MSLVPIVLSLPNVVPYDDSATDKRCGHKNLPGSEAALAPRGSPPMGFGNLGKV